MSRLREVEAEQVQHRVDDHVFRVIPQQVVGGPRHGNARGQQPLLELAQARFAAAIGVGDERAHDDAALHGRGERLLDLVAIEPEDEDVDRLLRGLDRLDDGTTPASGWMISFTVSLRQSCLSASRSTRPRPCRPARAP